MTSEIRTLSIQLDPASVDQRAVAATVCLPFDLRSRARLRACLNTGEDVAIVLPRGSFMREGAVISSADGSFIVKVLASDEELLEVRAADAFGLLKAAYHLGNRHVQLQVLPDCLRLPYDYVLAEMVERMGAKAVKVFASFDPEVGAYSGAPSGHHAAHEH
jgi:urease accessory protein